MILFLQFTICDLRPFFPLREELLQVLSWPSPDLYQQVRGSGLIVERTRKGLDSWIGENTICRINKGIAIVAQKKAAVRIRNVSKHQFTSKGGIMTKYELVFKVDNYYPDIGNEEIEEVIQSIMDMKIRIKNVKYQSEYYTLSELAKPLKDFHLLHSTSHKEEQYEDGSFFDVAAHRAKLQGCTPQLYIYLDKGERLKNFTRHQRENLPFLIHSFSKKIRGTIFRIWINELSLRYLKMGVDTHRELRISTLRMFSETECLHTVLKRIATGDLQVAPFSTESNELQKYLNEMISTVLKDRVSSDAVSLQKISLEYFHDTFFRFFPGNYDLLNSYIRDFRFRPQIENKAINYYTEITNNTEIINVMAENVDISNSGNTFTGNTGSIFFETGAVSITNSFNKIRDAYGEDAAQALLKTAKIVEESGSDEAKELFTSFNEELEKEAPKKSVLKTLWTNLCAVVPLIKSSMDVYDKVSGLFT